MSYEQNLAVLKLLISFIDFNYQSKVIVDNSKLYK